MNYILTEVLRRSRQLGRIWRFEGSQGVARRVRRRIALAAMPPGSETLAVSDTDFEAAASLARTGWKLPGPARLDDSGSLQVGWVCTPPTPGSGGHTTMFRMAEALQRSGHRSTIYLMDRHHGDFQRHLERIQRGWPNLKVSFRDFDQGVADSHAVFATGWESAWALLGSSALGLRSYFVQDFEPSFYPAGSDYLLAEATYRFGFQGITMGNWLPEVLSRYDMKAAGLDFGCDLTSYSLQNPSGARRAICYYCRPSTPRRAHELALASLRIFAKRNPATPIHFYGEVVSDPGFSVTQHATLTPGQLGDLYNDCAGGLVLSATNVSLVPHEMLAAGCIPIVNDADQNRVVLANDEVLYSEATPHAIAHALETVVRQTDAQKQQRAVQAAASVAGRSWASIEDDFVRILVDLVRGSR